jgi:hypothetical protein
MAQPMESPDVMPTIIFPESWEAAMVIDQEVYNFMAEYGLKRVEGASKMMTVIARIVQLAINKHYARAVAEIEAADRKATEGK